ncbi:MAG: S41 family peptidase [Sedimentisphaerales bacterium]|nr:S41 family peptidase [Sedimentisphaerales bacterium]
MPPSKRGMMGIRNARVTLLLLASCASILVLSCWFSGYNYASHAGMAVQATGSSIPAAGLGASVQPPAKTDPVTMACDLIARGQFQEAAKYVTQLEPTDDARVQEVKGIAEQYDKISQARGAAKEAAFHEQCKKLEKLKSVVDLDRPPQVAKRGNEMDPVETAPAREPNEPNDITDVLAVVAKAEEFANEAQRKSLLADPYVTQVIQKAMDYSTLLEGQGRWLDAYMSYFYWLQAIDPNNKTYTTRAEDLVDKAGIAASFQDSPCETCAERYEGVDKTMFERSIEALNLHYVNNMDYVQMATKAIKRCELLAQVLTVVSAEGTETGKGISFQAPEPEKVTAWTVALAGLQDEIQATAKSAKESSRSSQPAEDNAPVRAFGKDEFLKILDKVLALNEATVQLPMQPLIAHFVEASLDALDPYTVIVWPRQVQDFEKLMTNEFTGIGIEITKPKGLLTVASLLPDTPAYRAGLDAGDVIECVDGIATKDMSLMCAVKKITGPKGTTVTLNVRRGKDVQTLTITRDRIIVPTIRGWQRTASGCWLYMLDDKEKIGYVRITSFSGETAGDLETTLDQLESEGLRGLILDLRFNTGGLLDSAVNVVDKFINEGLIVRTQPKANMIPAFEHAHRRGTHPNYPLVILINSSSASASEIVAGALADRKYERAVLVGTRTHGKGSVQGITHYPGGGAELKYTMAYYHLPSGQRVKSREDTEKEGTKDWGVGPDVRVELTSEELRQMVDVQRDNDVLVQANREEGRTTVNKRALEDTLKADPQLAVGLLVVKAKLVNMRAVAAN